MSALLLGKLYFVSKTRSCYGQFLMIADRAVRAGSQQTRRDILLMASRLFAERGYTRVSVQQVAESAGVFPNQVTYYFGSKESLFVEAAGRLILEAGQAAEIAAQSAESVRDYRRVLAESILGEGLPSFLAFVEATLIARRRADLAPQIKATLDRLHQRGARATLEILTRKQWQIETAPEIAAQNFWTIMMGVALQSERSDRARRRLRCVGPRPAFPWFESYQAASASL